MSSFSAMSMAVGAGGRAWMAVGSWLFRIADPTASYLRANVVLRSSRKVWNGTEPSSTVVDSSWGGRGCHVGGSMLKLVMSVACAGRG